MSKESKMEQLEKTWILEIVVAAVMTAILAALVGLGGWTANKVVQNGEKIVELNGKIAVVNEKIATVDAKIATVDAKIAAVDAKLDLLIRGLNISVAPKDNVGAGPAGAERGGFRVGAGETATE
ncbi:MAG: hypothetical protein OXU43_07695 [Gammaproteobacteria bacterium]|nr:hypothetical protein [Gammaproteobacteria bacterium]